MVASRPTGDSGTRSVQDKLLVACIRGQPTPAPLQHGHEAHRKHRLYAVVVRKSISGLPLAAGGASRGSGTSGTMAHDVQRPPIDVARRTLLLLHMARTRTNVIPQVHGT